MSFSMETDLYFGFNQEKLNRTDTLALATVLLLLLHDMLGWQDWGPNSDYIDDQAYSSYLQKNKATQITNILI